jgi:hypothetical protein
MLILSDWYSKISSLLTCLDLTLDNSISSVWVFSDTTISSYKSSISSYWITYNTNNSSFVALKNSINSFLDTYKNNEESLLKQIELLEADKKIYVKWLDINLEINESTLSEAISNKNLTLRQLNTVIVDAEIAYKQALRNVEKLWIRSPITWTIWEILINVWQEVWVWTPLFNISNNSENEVEVAFSKDELNFVKSWNIAYVELDGNTYTWSIYSISNVADSNLNYISKISFDDEINFIWDVVKVIIPFKTDKLILPINIIKVDNLWMWVINIFNSWSIEQKSLKIGNIYSDKIEVLEEVDSSLDIIVTDISNYDNWKFNLKLK